MSDIMAKSTNYTERLQVWSQWRKIVGGQIQPLYIRYVELKNKLAVIRGFEDYGDEWRQKYEMEGFQSEVMNMYEQLAPLYRELHAYIRRKLWKLYGDSHIDLKGPIPAHLLSDMWGRFWNNLYSVNIFLLIETFPILYSYFRLLNPSLVKLPLIQQRT